MVHVLAQGARGDSGRPLNREAGVRASIAAFALVGACVDPVAPRAAVPTLDDATGGVFASVSVGLAHSCALTTDGTAYCWGSNESGQLGVAPGATTCPKADRRVTCEPEPKAVSGSLKFQRISAGGEHTCAIGLDGRVYCWGDNLQGQLGDPALRQTYAPAPILSAALFFDVAAGDLHTCALRSDAVPFCWGANEAGQLGVATIGTGSATPVQAQTSLRFASLAAGRARTCARQADGISYCWGLHWISSTVQGSEITRPQAQPLRVPSAPALQSLSVGAQTTCGLGVDAVVYCWEANPTGAIGDGTTTGHLSPIAANTTLRFVSVTAGASQACGVAETGYVYCWGSDDVGQLAIPPSTVSRRCGSPGKPCVVSPSRISGWRQFTQVAAGLGNHVCGVTLGASVYCWGAGRLGQRGDGRAFSDWAPARVVAP